MEVITYHPIGREEICTHNYTGRRKHFGGKVYQQTDV